METASIFKCSLKNKGGFSMDKLNREILRMELQISELIRIAANLNERLKKLEDGGVKKTSLNVPHYSKGL